MGIALRKAKESFNFYESFSDMLFNTLVLFLVLIVGLVVLVSNETAKINEKGEQLEAKTKEAEEKLDELRGEETALMHDRDKLRREKEKLVKDTEVLEKQKIDLGNTIATKTEEFKKEAREAEEKAGKIKEALAAFVGMKGKLKNVVILVDLSGSMVGGFNPQGQFVESEVLKERFARVREEISNLIEHLDFEKFNVIGFGGSESGSSIRIEVEADLLFEANTENRRRINDALNGWRAIGGTPTGPALERAFNHVGVDTIIVYSDGSPTLPTFSQTAVLELCRQRNGSDQIVINSVGIGAYDDQMAANPNGQDEHEMTFVEFMRRLALENGGSFTAR